jgi:DNA-binding MarR family transcriptional regulator
VSEQAAPLLVDQIEDDVELLISVAARLNRTSAVLLASLEVPLTFRQYRTLRRVAGGYTSLGQLARRGNLSLPTVSESVDGLVKRGLIRTAQSEADRRAIVLHATDAGRAAAEAGHRALSELVGSLLDGFSAEQRSWLQKHLEQIYEAATVYFVENIQGQAQPPNTP